MKKRRKEKEIRIGSQNWLLSYEKKNWNVDGERLRRKKKKEGRGNETNVPFLSNLDSEENLERISICMRPQTVHTPTHDPKPGAGTMNLALFFLEAQLFHSLLLSTAPLKQPLPPPDGIKDQNHVETQLKVIFGVFKCIMISPVLCAISTSGKKRSTHCLNLAGVIKNA